MTAKKRRIVVALGAVLATSVVLCGAAYVYMRPYLPDKVSFEDGHITLFYVRPYNGDR